MTQTQIIQTAALRYQPQTHETGDHALNQIKMAFFVGLVAVGLPTVLLIAGLFGFTCTYDSISHFYYAGWLGSCFVGALIFIGTYLLAYHGLNPGERHLSTIAGYCAYGVALFPTSHAGCDDGAWSGRAFVDLALKDNVASVTNPAGPDLFNLFAGASFVHLGSALLLFIFLAWFSLVVFTREIPERDRIDGVLKPVKRLRNRIYIATGWVIAICIAGLALRKGIEILMGSEIEFWNDLNLTFWLEAIALYAFGIAWMVKGRFWNLALLD